MASESTLISRVRSSLNDSAGERFSDEDSIKTELYAEARAIFSSAKVPSDLLLGVCSTTDFKPDANGLFEAPEGYLRLCTGYLNSIRIDYVVMSGELAKPMTEQRIATKAHPHFYVEGASTYVLPPCAFEGVTGDLYYIPEQFELSSIPPAFEDAVVYGAASRMAYNAGEKMLGEIMESRAAQHLIRALGGTTENKK